jgi:hypothetical protein
MIISHSHARANARALKRSEERGHLARSVRHVAGQLLLLAPGLTGQKRSAGRMPAFLYTPRLKNNRYSSNRIMAPTTDMIQPAT